MSNDKRLKEIVDKLSNNPSFDSYYLSLDSCLKKDEIKLFEYIWERMGEEGYRRGWDLVEPEYEEEGEIMGPIFYDEESDRLLRKSMMLGANKILEYLVDDENAEEAFADIIELIPISTFRMIRKYLTNRLELERLVTSSQREDLLLEIGKLNYIPFEKNLDGLLFKALKEQDIDKLSDILVENQDLYLRYGFIMKEYVLENYKSSKFLEQFYSAIGENLDEDIKIRNKKI